MALFHWKQSWRHGSQSWTCIIHEWPRDDGAVANIDEIQACLLLTAMCLCTIIIRRNNGGNNHFTSDFADSRPYQLQTAFTEKFFFELMTVIQVRFRRNRARPDGLKTLPKSIQSSHEHNTWHFLRSVTVRLRLGFSANETCAGSPPESDDG